MHGVGGMVGTFLAGILVSNNLGVFSGNGLADGMTIGVAGRRSSNRHFSNRDLHSNCYLYIAEDRCQRLPQEYELQTNKNRSVAT